MDIGEDLVGKVAEFGEWLEARVRTQVSVAEVPEQTFIDYARRHPGLIVLESTRTPVRQRAFFGHDVDYLLRYAPCPVGADQRTAREPFRRLESRGNEIALAGQAGRSGSFLQKPRRANVLEESGPHSRSLDSFGPDGGRSG